MRIVQTLVFSYKSAQAPLANSFLDERAKESGNAMTLAVKKDIESRLKFAVERT